MNSVSHDHMTDCLYEVTPRRVMQDLVLPDVVLEAVADLIEEQHRRDLLRSYNIEPRHKFLLVGPPGNGKRSSATMGE